MSSKLLDIYSTSAQQDVLRIKLNQYIRSANNLLKAPLENK